MAQTIARIYNLYIDGLDTNQIWSIINKNCYETVISKQEINDVIDLINNLKNECELNAFETQTAE
jgi:hypothetical protein